MPDPIKTVLFDLDGTLVDSRSDLAASVNFALKSTGFKEKPASQIIPYVGNGLRDLLKGVFGKVDEKTLEVAISAFQVHYEEHCVDKTVLYENVQAALDDLSGRSRIGIITNKPKHFAEKILEKLGVLKQISNLFGGDSFPEKKPHPRPVLESLRQLEAHPESTLMVGDGSQDIQAGQAAGIRTCAARYGYGFVPETLALNPDYVIDSFNQLKEIVK